MNRHVLVSAVAGGLVLAGVAAWAWHAGRPADNPNRLTLYGNVDIRQVALAFNGTERIVELRAREGDRVHAGDVLGVLDTSTLRLRLDQSAAQIGAQEQAVLRLKTGSRPEEIAQARATAMVAEAEADLASRQVARLEATSDATLAKAVSRQDMDGALARLSVTRAQVTGARMALALVIAGPRREDVAQAVQQLAGARAEKALIQRQIDEAQLHSPLDAVVRARLLEPGDMASPQRPAFTLAITRPKWVRAYIAEGQLGRIQPGMNAGVSTDSHPGHGVPARIGYISSVAEFTPKTVQTPELRTSLVYEVRFEVADPADELRLGMPATVTLELQPPRAGPP